MGHAAVLAESRSVLEVGHFPADWENFNFKDIKRHSDYRLAEEDGKVVVKAEAYASASGLFRKISIDPREYPIIQWSWKVVNILKKGNVYRKEGDDYPARVFIIFEYEPGRFSRIITLHCFHLRILEWGYLATQSLHRVSSECILGKVLPKNLPCIPLSPSSSGYHSVLLSLS